MRKSSIFFNRFFMAFIALTFFFVFACSSSDSNSVSLDGTWYMDYFELKISGKDYTLKYNDIYETKGTVTYDNSTFEFTIIYDWDWYEEEWIPTSVSESNRIISGHYTRNGDVSVFSEVSDDMYDGEWKKK
jgi:uncharacterized protein YcfL